MTAILGIDTSSYTTSLSVVCDNVLISDKRLLLTVEKGKRGLRQSEAVFQHVANLPLLMKEVKKDIGQVNIDAVGVSIKPRPVESSYMPVFKAGQSFAHFLGSFLNKPVFELSHQEGHIEAGLYSADFKPEGAFLALHLSGGTSEILRVVPHWGGYDIEIAGGSSDISAGQFIDRVGVRLGFHFPSGKYVDSLSLKGDCSKNVIPPYSENAIMSFSGQETAAYRLMEKGVPMEDICASVMECISRTIIDSVKWCMHRYGIRRVLFVGGVSSSSYIKNRLKHELSCGENSLYFCSPSYCTDNSVGIAYLACRLLQHSERR